MSLSKTHELLLSTIVDWDAKNQIKQTNVEIYRQENIHNFMLKSFVHLEPIAKNPEKLDI